MLCQGDSLTANLRVTSGVTLNVSTVIPQAASKALVTQERSEVEQTWSVH